MQEVMSVPKICQSFVFGEQDHCQRSGTVTAPKVEQNQAALLLNWGLNCLEMLHSYSQVFTFIFAAVPLYVLMLTWLCWLVCANTACTD